MILVRVRRFGPLTRVAVEAGNMGGADYGPVALRELIDKMERAGADAWPEWPGNGRPAGDA